MDSIFFIEGHLYRKEKIPKNFINKQYFEPYKKTSEYKLKVAGLSVSNNKTYFFLPKNTSKKLTDEKKIEFGKISLKSILKYRNENRLSSEEEYWLGRENSNAELFDTVNWLVDDYKKHGIYIEEEIYKSNSMSDPIDWSKTIKDTQPFVIDQQIVYPDLITYSKRTNRYSMLAAIHNNTILKITQKYNWLFNVSKRKEYLEIDLNLNQQIIYLQQELNQTTNTRTQMLIMNILIFLKSSELEDQTFDMVTPYFQNVWEDAIQQVFSHDLNLQTLVGKPYWKFKNGDIRESNQFPDVLIEIDNNLVIIDAKYYSLDETLNNNLPGWSSLVKQMYYNLSMDTDYKFISNLFLIPRYFGLEENIDYIGYASVADYEESFGLVYAFNLNTKILLDDYLLEIIRPDLTRSLLEQIDSILI